MKPSVFFIFALLILLCANNAHANEDKDLFNAGISIGDGKSGRPWGQWNQLVKEVAIDSVSAIVSKKSGGSDCYLNLRFGKGSALDRGKRVQLNSTGSQAISWTLGNELPKKQPLVMNAYNCEVFIESVVVRYRPSSVSGHPDIVSGSVGGGMFEDSGIVSSPGEEQLSGWSRKKSEDSVLRRCRRFTVRAPRVDMGRLLAIGGLFSGKYRGQGSIYGQCVEEVGYFEFGRLKQAIEFPLDENFKRKEFDLEVRTGHNAEIRIYTTDGKQTAIGIDAAIGSQGGFGF